MKSGAFANVHIRFRMCDLDLCQSPCMARATTQATGKARTTPPRTAPQSQTAPVSPETRTTTMPTPARVAPMKRCRVKRSQGMYEPFQWILPHLGTVARVGIDPCQAVGFSRATMHPQRERTTGQHMICKDIREALPHARVPRSVLHHVLDPTQRPHQTPPWIDLVTPRGRTDRATARRQFLWCGQTRGLGA